MKDKTISQNSENKNHKYVIPGFIGAAIGGILGLVAYVKDWL